ncbi:MAG: hypothetical protein ABW110_25045 [Steroidobacteraceae bacterium]
MSSLFRLVAIAFVLLCANAAAQAQSPGCGAMEFSKEVLARFPNAPRACLDVVTRNQEPYGVFKAKIARVYEQGNSIDLKFKLPDGSYSDTRHLKTSPDLRVGVRGQPTRVNDLVVGDEVSVYVKMHEPVLALAPAEESVQPEFTPIAPAEPPQQQVAAAMPTTAGYRTTIGLMGALLLVTALVLFVARTRVNDR